MTKVVIYSTNTCPYCERAKELFHTKNIEYVEYKVDQEEGKLEEMLSLSNGQRTVPQIFINDVHIGGFDDLKELQEQGKLNSMLSGS